MSSLKICFFIFFFLAIVAHSFIYAKQDPLVNTLATSLENAKGESTFVSTEKVRNSTSRVQISIDEAKTGTEFSLTSGDLEDFPNETTGNTNDSSEDIVSKYPYTETVSNEQISLSIFLDKTVVSVGQIFSLKVVVEYAPDLKVVLPYNTIDFSPYHLYDYSISTKNSLHGDSAKNKFSITYDLALFSLTAAFLPDIIIPYRSLENPDSPFEEIKIDGPSIGVVRLSFSDTNSLAQTPPMKSPFIIQTYFQESDFFFLMFLVIVIVILFRLFIGILRREKKQKTHYQNSLVESLIQSCILIDRSPNMPTEELKTFYGKISKSVKQLAAISLADHRLLSKTARELAPLQTINDQPNGKNLFIKNELLLFLAEIEKMTFTKNPKISVQTLADIKGFLLLFFSFLLKGKTIKRKEKSKIKKIINFLKKEISPKNSNGFPFKHSSKVRKKA